MIVYTQHWRYKNIAFEKFFSFYKFLFDFFLNLFIDTRRHWYYLIIGFMDTLHIKVDMYRSTFVSWIFYKVKNSKKYLYLFLVFQKFRRNFLNKRLFLGSHLNVELICYKKCLLIYPPTRITLKKIKNFFDKLFSLFRFRYSNFKYTFFKYKNNNYPFLFKSIYF